MNETTETVTEKKKPGPKPKEPGEKPAGLESDVLTAEARADLKAMAAKPAEKEGIPVKVLKVRQGVGIDVPGRVGMSSTTSIQEHFGTSQAHWVITYKPWTRHHHVVYHHAGGQKRESFMLHEAYCGWEPM